jgi:hypothetical protein
VYGMGDMIVSLLGVRFVPRWVLGCNDGCGSDDGFYENIVISVRSRKAIALPAYQLFT